VLLTAVRTESFGRHFPQHVEAGFVGDDTGRELAAADWAFDQYVWHATDPRAAPQID